MQANNDGIHKGHRQRMRAKLKAHGARVFDTYELLEMLLYYVVPYKDTNPIAKRLISAFGSVDGVFRASREELCLVEGVGESIADFILTAGRVTDVARYLDGVKSTVFDDYGKSGEYFVRYFDNNPDTNIVLILLDDCMHMIAEEKMPGENFGSGAVQPKHYISAALKHQATVAMIGYTHRASVPFPYSGDYESCRMLRYELMQVGVTLVEQYCVGGGDYTGAKLELEFKMPPSEEMLRFLKGRGQHNGG